MTDLQRFNIDWLCNAMTVALTDPDHYYYDGRSKTFFIQRSPVLLNMIGLSLEPRQADELRERLADIDSGSSEIVELPRLNVQDKVAVQLLFLSEFPGIIHEENLRLAAEQQTDAPGFILDKLEVLDEALAPMSSYWEDFKLKTVQYYLERFTGIIGITLKMI